MLFLLSLLLLLATNELSLILATNDNCLYYDNYPIDCVYSLSSYTDSRFESHGYKCTDNNTVTLSYYNKSDDCSGESYLSYIFECNDNDNNCNCDKSGSLDGCSIAILSLNSCDDNYEYSQSYKYLIDKCYKIYSTYGNYASYQCDGSSNIELVYYDNSECNEESDDQPYTDSITSNSYCTDCKSNICLFYYDISCKAAANINNPFSFKILIIISVVFIAFISSL